MLHWHTIWKHMRKLTNREIEKRAVMKLINYFESQIDAVIKQSRVELNKINKLRQIQGLKPKARIDQDCIKNAIKTINSNGDSPMPEKAGGENREKECDEHSQIIDLEEIFLRS